LNPSEWPRLASEASSGSLGLKVNYKRGSRSSKVYIPFFNSVLTPALCCPTSRLFDGSLNLWAENPVHLPSPQAATLGGIDWHFVPIVLKNEAVGVVARCGESGDTVFLEVFACEELVPRLGLSPGDSISIYVLPGHYLELGP
jgi:hypothetical protein